MTGTGEGDDDPATHRHAAEIARLAAQLDALRRPTVSQGSRRTGTTVTPYASRSTSGSGSEAETGTPVDLMQVRRERDGQRSAPTNSLGAATRRRPQRSGGQDAGGAVIPFRRAGESPDQDTSAHERPIGHRRTPHPTPAERRARQDAAREMAAATLATQLEADPESVARELCLGWLAHRPHTRAELTSKLKRKGVPGEAAGSVLERLGEVGLIDDAAFAAAWVQSRHTGRGLARRALVYELRGRGIESSTVDAAVSSLEPDEEAATARALVTRKLAGMGHVPVEARARRLMGMLARKGYPGAMAAAVVREVIAGSGVDLPDPDLG